VYDAALLADEVDNAMERGMFPFSISSTDAPTSGRVLKACGSAPALGGWNIQDAAELKVATGAPTSRLPISAVATVDVDLPVGETTEFKLVECNADGSDPRWQV
jgi:hypothetical protein